MERVSGIRVGQDGGVYGNDVSYGEECGCCSLQFGCEI